MYLWRFSDEQKKAFLALAYQVALADHWVPEPEEKFFGDLRQRLGTSVKISPESLIGEPDLGPFQDHEARVIVLLELTALAYSDDNFHINESHMLMGVAKRLGVTDAEFSSIKDWSQRLAVLNREALVLMNG